MLERNSLALRKIFRDAEKEKRFRMLTDFVLMFAKT